MKAGDGMNHVLGLDFGTQGIKGLIVSEKGEILLSAFRHYGFSKNEDGCMEEDPHDWVCAAAEVIRELKEKNVALFDRIASVGISGHMHGPVVLSSGGAVLHPCILWCDTRSTDQMERMRTMLAPDEQKRLENPFVTAYTAGKLMWIRENCPQIWEKTSVFLYCKDYIRYLMTGNIATDYSDASGSLLYDFKKNDWSDQALQAIGISKAQLPPILPSSAQAGRVTVEGARIFGLKEGIPVAVGAGDLAASLFGSGIHAEKETLINLGTAGQILALQARGSSRKEGGYLFKFLDQEKDMLLYSIPSAAYCARWYVEQICPSIRDEADRMGESVFERMHRYASESPTGSRGLLFAPYLSGTGSPYFDDMMRGAWIGLDSAHHHQDMARSILEGVAFGIKQCIETGEQEDQKHRIYLTGGGARSGLWRQIFADVLEREVTYFSVSEAAGMGAAKLAMIACGMDAERIQIPLSRVLADSAHREVYRKAYQSYTRIYGALKSI